MVSEAESGSSATPAKVLAILSQLETFADSVSPQPPITSSSPQPFISSPTEETIRVSIGKLDALMAQLSELMAAKIRAEQRLAEAGMDRDAPMKSAGSGSACASH